MGSGMDAKGGRFHLEYFFGGPDSGIQCFGLAFLPGCLELDGKACPKIIPTDQEVDIVSGFFKKHGKGFHHFGGLFYGHRHPDKVFFHIIFERPPGIRVAVHDDGPAFF
jgi:hypothetical protein